MSLPYWKSYTDSSGQTYSCDMVRITLEMRLDCVNELNAYLNNPHRADIKEYPPNFTAHKYRYMWTIDYCLSSMTVGLSFNGDSKGEAQKGFLEFNPNKTMNNPQIEEDLEYILSRCIDNSVSIARWDLAIDIPVNRSLLRMKKDRRIYELVEKSKENFTEYLGARNTPGRVKLYNKDIESELGQDMTRLEITLGDIEMCLGELKRVFPVVTTKSFNAQKNFVVDEDLTQSEKVFLELLLDVEDTEYYFSRLSYKMRKKFEPLISGTDKQLSYDVNQVNRIIADLRALLQYSQSPLPKRELFASPNKADDDKYWKMANAEKEIN